MNPRRCSECSRESTYDIPVNYCDLHWLLWWTAGWEQDGTTGWEQDGTKKELRQERIDLLESTWKKYGRPDDADSIIDEL